MSTLGRRVLLAMIPVNLLMLAWVWVGRIVFGAGGWFLLIMLYALPFLFLALLVTTLIGFLGADRPRALTPAQAVAQLGVWLGMLGFGFFLVDFGDAPESDLSAFTQVVGRTDATLSLSWTLTGLSAVLAVLAWVVLLVLLVAQRRRRTSLPAEAYTDPVRR